MQLKRQIFAALAILMFSMPALAQQANESIRPLLLDAIKNGQAHGEMGGQVREAFARMFGSTAPILVIVERLEELATSGCYRLRVTTTQAGIYEFDPKTRVRSLTPADQRLSYKVSYCANGHFPEEGGGR